MKITFIKTGKRVKPKSKRNTVREKINQKNVEDNKLNIKDAIKTIFKKNQIVILTLALMLVTAGYMNYNNISSENDISLAELGDAKLVSTEISEETQNSNEEQGENESEQEQNNEENKLMQEQNDEENKLMQEQNNEENKSIQEQNNETTNFIQEQNNITNIVQTNSEAEPNREKNNIEENNQKAENYVIETSSNGQDYYAQTRLERETMYSQMIETYQKLIENDNIPADQKSIAVNEIKNINDRKNAISIIENLIKTKGFKDAVILINDNNINAVIKKDENLTQEQVAQITNIVSRELNAEIEDIHITIHK